MALLSGIIITHNEADRLATTVESMKAICDEIIIVDSGSTDHTVSLAHSLGCRVLERAFDGFGTQKQFAVEQAKNDWVLVIDADEVISTALANEINHSLLNPFCAGYFLPRTFVFLGKAMKGGHEEKKKYLRLFDRTKGSFSADKVHEDVTVSSGEVKWLKNTLLHSSYRDIHHYFVKFNQYTSLGAEEVHRNGKHISTAILAARMPITFVQYFLFKGYFRDGYQGFLWSLFSSLYPVVKYAKAREIKNK